MRRLGIISEKGGTAKTTTTINLSVGLAKRGHKVLVVDVDPQGNASLVLLGEQGSAGPTLGAVLLGEADVTAAIRSTATPGLDLLPADVSLADANLGLVNEVGRECRLRAALEAIEQDYDFVILDTSPQRSLLTVNALVYVHEAIVPVDPGVFSMAGLGQLQGAIDDVRRYLHNRELRVAGLVLTRTVVTNVCRDVQSQLREMFGALVYATVIPTNSKVEEAHSRYQSVLDYAPRSAGAKAYDGLVTEIIANGTGTQYGPGELAQGTDAADDGTAAADAA